MNIYGKLILLCLTLVIFTAGILSFFADRQVKKGLREDITSNISQQSQTISSDIGQFISSRMNELRVASENENLQSQNINRNQANQFLRKIEEINPIYYSFSFYSNDRLKIADSKGRGINRPDPQFDYWDKLNSGNEEVVTISASEALQQNVMYFAKKVDGKNGDRYSGVLVSSILIDEFYNAIEDYNASTRSSRDLEVTMIDEDGLILYSSARPDAALKESYKNQTVLDNLTTEGLLEADDQLFFTSADREFSDLVGSDWKLILSVDKEIAFKPLLEIRKQILFAVVPVIILSIFLAVVAANYFVKPIITLSKAAEEFSKGNLDVPVSIRTNDEVGRLAKQLSGTSESLIKQLKEQKKLNKQLQEQKTLTEIQKNQLVAVSSQIGDSIGYAERIQRASLPPLATLTKVFPNSFVTYKPKDVIGGDFYWFESIRRGNNEYMIIACGDCTGHGVPGAIMSIMGSNQLTNIVYYQNYLDPKKIITRLDKVIKSELQSESDEVNRDGMEIGVCVIDLDTLRMEFAGVGIPLRLVRHKSEEMTFIKTPRMMVGGIEGDEQEVHASLKKETIQLNPKDRIFLSSDGFQDQFGGDNDKKFLSRNFNKLLFESSKLPIIEQQQKIQNTFLDWSKNTSQTDDVCIVGFEAS